MNLLMILSTLIFTRDRHLHSNIIQNKNECSADSIVTVSSVSAVVLSVSRQLTSELCSAASSVFSSVS